jgi:hypothetical protein
MWIRNACYVICVLEMLVNMNQFECVRFVRNVI